MTHITEHNTEEERESNACKYCRVDFFILGDTVSINNFLKWPCEFVNFEICRGLYFVVIKSLKISCGIVLKYFSDFFF